MRMQEKVPKPQRAWLYLPKDATLVHYAKRIKVERDHVLEDIMPSVQRTLFGTAATSLKEYIPLNGVARLDALIGAEEESRPVRARRNRNRRWRYTTRRTACGINIGCSSVPWLESAGWITDSSMRSSSSGPGTSRSGHDSAVGAAHCLLEKWRVPVRQKR